MALILDQFADGSVTIRKAAKPVVAKFIVVHAERNGFLFSFDLGWYTNCGDDPTCWTDDRSKAKKYTRKQIDKMLPYFFFQGTPTIEEV